MHNKPYKYYKLDAKKNIRRKLSCGILNKGKIKDLDGRDHSEILINDFVFLNSKLRRNGAMLCKIMK